MIDAGLFLDEAAELLIELESALLELENNPSDSDLIQRVFRALHTIKGSGAMFGFDSVSRFTHEIEAVFDLVREGRLEATPQLINLTLNARDLIKTLLAGGATATSDLERIGSTVEQFRKLSSGETGAPVASSRAHRVEEDVPAKEEVQADAPKLWHIYFRPVPEIMIRGTKIGLLFGELDQLGELEIEAITERVPDIADMDPETCYVKWDLRLKTACGLDSIRDVFIFVEDSSELRIEQVTEKDAGTDAEAEESADSLLSAATAVSPQAADIPVPGASEPAAESSSESRETRSSISKASIRVAADKLDALLNFVGELVIVQARLTDLALRSSDPETVLIAEEVERLSAGLRDSAMSMRMLPLRGTFDRFRRLIHDLTRNLGKEIQLMTEGGETELDKTVIDQLNDPLLHLIRNSADHGIETPEERVAAGKPRAGTIRLSALYSGANVLIQIGDDGRGLNAEAIRERAIEKGLIPADTKLAQADLLALILMPGFSTARTVTDVSGRGVGMDVVRRNVEALRGSIEVASTQGAGTTVTLRLPLTLAIIDGLLVRVGEAHFVVPLSNVVECIELTREEADAMHGKHLVNVRGDLVPYIPLRDYFAITGSKPPIEQIIIVETRDGRFGFALDEVLGDHQTVIKNLGRIYRDVQVISGATIMGDGSIALILDPHRLVQDVAGSENENLRGGDQK